MAASAHRVNKGIDARGFGKVAVEVVEGVVPRWCLNAEKT